MRFLCCKARICFHQNLHFSFKYDVFSLKQTALWLVHMVFDKQHADRKQFSFWRAVAFSLLHCHIDHHCSESSWRWAHENEHKPMWKAFYCLEVSLGFLCVIADNCTLWLTTWEGNIGLLGGFMECKFFTNGFITRLQPGVHQVLWGPKKSYLFEPWCISINL